MRVLKIGHSNGEDVTITKEEQFKHVFIYAGNNPAKLNHLTLGIINQKIEADQGIIIIQGASNALKDIFINTVKSSKRSDALVVLKDLSDYDSPEKINQFILNLITRNKLAYISFDGINKMLHTRLFMQALSEVMDILRLPDASRSYKQCNIITTNVENVQSKRWMKILTFARLCKIAMFTSAANYKEVMKLKEDLSPMYSVIDDLFNASQTKILFSQGDRNTDLELSRIAGIKGFVFQHKEIVRADSKSKNANGILNALKERQYIMIYEDSVTPVTF